MYEMKMIRLPPTFGFNICFSRSLLLSTNTCINVGFTLVFGKMQLDVDEMASTDSNQYEYGGQSQQKLSQPKSINTLNTINAVLLRKNALNKLSRYVK